MHRLSKIPHCTNRLPQIFYSQDMNTHSKILLICLGLILNFATDTQAIQILAEEGNDCSIQSYIVNGDIRQGDSILFASAASAMKDIRQTSCKEKEAKISKRPYILIKLNSAGGEVEEAIKIGEIIRENEFLVSVPDGAECLSSCIFILSAGIYRSGSGKVGIHRPYFSTIAEGESIQNIRRKRDDVLTIIKQYVEKMDINPRLVDTMMSIPPGELKILTDDELSYYRLSGMDASYEEKFIAEAARSYGLTSFEYRKRWATVEQQCGLLPVGKYTGWTLCREAILLGFSKTILLGISKNESIIREKRYMDQCDELPSSEKAECFKRVMNPKN